MQTLWKNGTKKAFYGSVAQIAITLINWLIATVSPDSSLFIVTRILNIAAYVYFIMGIIDMKKAAAGTCLEGATKRLFVAIVVAVVGIAIKLIPGTDFISWIPELAAYILFWTGYAMIKTNAVNWKANFGGRKLCLASLISLIIVLVGLIPVIGTIAGLILNIFVVAFTIQGWKAIAESEL